MSAAFEFATAGRILFGAGTIAQVPAEAAKLGRRVLLVTGKDPGRSAGLAAGLVAQGLAVTRFAVPGEPSTDLAAAGTALARAAACDVVVAIGGGSAIDTAKVIAALLANPGELYDYLEVVGAGRSLTQRPVPCIAAPTTAGTGAEVTRNSVLEVPAERVKVSLRHPWLLPALAVVDPELTYSAPPAVTACTGLDALTQVLEPFVSAAANPLTDALCRAALQRAGGALRRAYHHGQDCQAREDLALVSLSGGLALANAKLGAVHGFAGPLGGMFPAPHGAVCARLLPPVLAANVAALRERAPDSPALPRFAEAAQLLTGNPRATAADGVAFVRDLAAELGIPPLSAWGVTPADYPELVAKAQRASSMKGNPIVLTAEELQQILAAAG